MKTFELKKYADKFKAERIKDVIDFNAFSIPIVKGASFFIHIIPFNFLGAELLNLTKMSDEIIKLMTPMLSNNSGCSRMYNFGGYAIYRAFHDINDSSYATCYNQILRNGIYEIYTSDIFIQNEETKISNIYSDNLMEDSVNVIRNGLCILQKLLVEPPFFIYMSIHNVKGGIIIDTSSKKFTQENINIPPVILNEYITDIKQVIKLLFDILWQTVGKSCYPE
jgi:hypothetical protein